MEDRTNFYADELNMDRVNETLEYVASHLTLKEVLKMVREISYDMVCYYNEDAKGIIYNGEYNENHIWQACQLQRLLSSAAAYAQDRRMEELITIRRIISQLRRFLMTFLSLGTVMEL